MFARRFEGNIVYYPIFAFEFLDKKISTMVSVDGRWKPPKRPTIIKPICAPTNLTLLFLSMNSVQVEMDYFRDFLIFQKNAHDQVIHDITSCRAVIT